MTNGVRPRERLAGSSWHSGTMPLDSAPMRAPNSESPRDTPREGDSRAAKTMRPRPARPPLHGTLLDAMADGLADKVYLARNSDLKLSVSKLGRERFQAAFQRALEFNSSKSVHDLLLGGCPSLPYAKRTLFLAILRRFYGACCVHAARWRAPMRPPDGMAGALVVSAALRSATLVRASPSAG